jgi:hypothetical protein
MKVKTSDLIGPALDWAVAKCEWNREEGYWRGTYRADYSTDWAQGGPIIEQQEISIWGASPSIAKGAGGQWGYGQTPLIAAMRCYVASKLGDVVIVPDELN